MRRVPGAWLPAVDEVPTDTPMSRSSFIAALRSEAHRVDRSQAPMSVLLVETDHADASTLSAQMHACIRDTDRCGLLRPGLIGVLLPDTDAQGADRCADKLRATAALPITTTLLAHPHALIDALLLHPEGARTTSEPGPAEWSEGRAYRGKRLLDLVGASVALLLCAPLLLLTALAIALTSPGPVVFRQTRVGRRGQHFVLYKFRSMRWGVDDRVHQRYVTSFIRGELPQQPSATSADGPPAPVYKMKTDPRITVVGRFIRKTSIDELPQLLNVLQGHMSLVGPRPPLPYECEQYQPWHLRRLLDLRPGLTGLWQVDGRSRVSFDDMVRMDLRYIRDCSLRLDLHILCKTAGVLFGSDGAR